MEPVFAIIRNPVEGTVRYKELKFIFNVSYSGRTGLIICYIQALDPETGR
jgi:hypothetical protein